MANALVNIQIIPQTPPGADMIPYVDRAIAVIKDSGLPYRVGPLGTTLEGDLQACLEVIATMNQELHQQGCPTALSQVKIFYNAPPGSLTSLTAKYDHHV